MSPEFVIYAYDYDYDRALAAFIIFTIMAAVCVILAIVLEYNKIKRCREMVNDFFDSTINWFKLRSPESIDTYLKSEPEAWNLLSENAKQLAENFRVSPDYLLRCEIDDKEKCRYSKFSGQEIKEFVQRIQNSSQNDKKFPTLKDKFKVAIHGPSSETGLVGPVSNLSIRYGVEKFAQLSENSPHYAAGIALSSLKQKIPVTNYSWKLHNDCRSKEHYLNASREIAQAFCLTGDDQKENDAILKIVLQRIADYEKQAIEICRNKFSKFIDAAIFNISADAKIKENILSRRQKNSQYLSHERQLISQFIDRVSNKLRENHVSQSIMAAIDHDQQNICQQSCEKLSNKLRETHVPQSVVDEICNKSENGQFDILQFVADKLRLKSEQNNPVLLALTEYRINIFNQIMDNVVANLNSVSQMISQPPSWLHAAEQQRSDCEFFFDAAPRTKLVVINCNQGARHKNNSQEIDEWLMLADPFCAACFFA